MKKTLHIFLLLLFFSPLVFLQAQSEATRQELAVKYPSIYEDLFGEEKKILSEEAYKRLSESQRLHIDANPQIYERISGGEDELSVKLREKAEKKALAKQKLYDLDHALYSRLAQHPSSVHKITRSRYEQLSEDRKAYISAHPNLYSIVD